MTADRNHFFARLLEMHGGFTDEVKTEIESVWLERDHWLTHRGLLASRKTPDGMKGRAVLLWDKDADFDTKVAAFLV